MPIIDTELLKEYAENFGLQLDALALERIKDYTKLLLEVNKSLNLTAVTEMEEVLYKHWVDSLSLFSVIDPPQGGKFIDVGTGGGFPGVAVFIARPDLSVTLLDSTKKKLTFIESALEQLGLKAQIVHARAEEAAGNACYREKYDLAVARAVAPLNRLTEYCLPFVRPGGHFVAMKGANAKAEMQEANTAIRILGGSLKEIKKLNLPLAGERNLILIEHSAPAPAKYPRASGIISKKPL